MEERMRPVVVGVGQVANKDPERLVHPVELLEDATRRAVDDAGADVLAHVGMVLSSPLSVFSDDDGGAMLAERLGLPPGRRVQATYSGAGPQRLLAEACRAIAAGELDAALVVGGIADASVRNARRRGLEPPAPPTSLWSQGSDGTDDHAMSERTVARHRSMPFMAEAAAGALMPPQLFALVESALAAGAGRDPAAHRAWLGELLAPFTEVAARRPDLAWFPTARRPEELSRVTPSNRFVAEPYPKLMCSFPTIDLAAAVLVTSEALADRTGVDVAQRVHPWAVACAPEPGPPSTWPAMHRSRALRALVEHVLAGTGTSPDDLAGFDLYSCFPAAVQLALDAFGLKADDPRPFTRTGGLPYFGGPGASYSLHGVACTVEAVRADPGSVSAVVGVGGSSSDFSVGLYSVAEPTRPGGFEEATAVTTRLATSAVPIARTAEGVAVVDAMTVVHERDAGPVAAPVVARLADGRRIGARAGDPDLPAALSGTSLVGREVHLTVTGDHVTYRPA